MPFPTVSGVLSRRCRERHSSPMLPSRDYVDMHSATDVSCRRSRLGLAEPAFLSSAYLVPRLLSPPTWIDHRCILTFAYSAHGFLFLGFKFRGFADSEIVEFGDPESWAQPWEPDSWIPPVGPILMASVPAICFLYVIVRCILASSLLNCWLQDP